MGEGERDIQGKRERREEENEVKREVEMVEHTPCTSPVRRSLRLTIAMTWHFPPLLFFISFVSWTVCLTPDKERKRGEGRKRKGEEEMEIETRRNTIGIIK